MGFVSKRKFSTQTAIFQDCLHVKTKIINHKSQSNRRIEIYGYMPSKIASLFNAIWDICPMKKLFGIFRNNYEKFSKNLPMENGIT